jgi:hypothetical protein
MLLKLVDQNVVHDAALLFFYHISIEAAIERRRIIVCELWNTVLVLTKYCLQLGEELDFVFCNAQQYPLCVLAQEHGKFSQLL